MKLLSFQKSLVWPIITIGIVFLYIILWIIIPETDIPYSSLNKDKSEKSEESSAPGTNETKSKTSNDDFDYVNYYNQRAERKSNTGRIFVGIILIAFGFIFLAEMYFPFFDFQDLLPLALIAIGIILIWNSTKKNS